MRRKTLDLLLTTAGAGLLVVLLAAGALSLWGYSYANGTVHDQLAAEKIYFPPKGSPSLSPREYPDLQRYAGQQVVNGAQAEAYANGFIARHLQKIAGGQTYAQVSSQAQRQPTNQQLQTQRTQLFQGTTLRGLLLEAYAFWKIGQIARYVAIAAFSLAGLIVVLVALGARHARRVAPTEVVRLAEAA